MNYNYEYFSGANVTVEVVEGGARRRVVECAGLSYSVSTSRQPVYGYNSETFDVMLPGRIIVQGNLVVNFIEPNYLEKTIYGDVKRARNDKYNGPAFNINVVFGERKYGETIIDCYLISSGKTVQINEQVILEEYAFIGKSVIRT